jgi:hypothetical protein
MSLDSDQPTTIVIFSFFSPIFMAFHVFVCLVYLTFAKSCHTKHGNKHDQSCQTADTPTNTVIVVVHPNEEINVAATTTNPVKESSD